MTPYHTSERAVFYNGDCREVMATMEDNSIDSVVADPPYELGFMGKSWDKSGIAYDVEMWKQCLRVLKPGGHLLSFGGSRTYHRLACAIEDAGFEIRDQIMWLYGCLDEHTELVSEGGVKPYHKANIGELVLCYNLENGEYSYQPILEIVEYDYSDTAYSLVGDYGEQVVSRNHRCITQQDGSEVFQFAETLRAEACVPILENLSELQQALSHIQSDSGRTKQIMQYEVLQCADRGGEQYADSAGEAKREDGSLRCLRNEEMDAASMAEEDEGSSVQSRVQWRSQRRGVEGTRAQGAPVLDGRIESRSEDSNDGAKQSSLEGWLDLSESQGSVCRPANQVHSLPVGVSEHGAEGWLRDGAPSIGRSGDGQAAPESGSGASQESSCNGKSGDQPDALCDERGTQGIRAWRGHKAAVVRVVPFHYTGKMWCLRVLTGAFVAVRGGVAFPTGNSGFPKSLDVSKAIDKAARGVPQGGADPTSPNHGKFKGGCSEENPSGQGFGAGPVKFMKDARSKYDGANRKPAPSTTNGFGYESKGGLVESKPLTEDAERWADWGTALKPAHEPIVVARKPLSGTVVTNVLKHGTGALNIGACRIEGEPVPINRLEQWSGFGQEKRPEYEQKMNTLGRWPANVIHDGSDEVLATFPEAPGQQGDLKETGRNRPSSGRFGDMAPPLPHAARNDAGSSARFFFCAKDLEEETKNPENYVPNHKNKVYGEGMGGGFHPGFGDEGSAARFFYCAKTSGNDRHEGVEENNHPTVKPTALMRYLCRLVTRPGGTVLDCFMGSGSTYKAAYQEGFNFIGIEKEESYCAIAIKRVAQNVFDFNA